MAFGIGTMHYVGMEAIRMNAHMVYDFTLFVISILVATMVSSVFVESAGEINASLYEVLDIDADTYGRVKDDLIATFPAIRELAAMLFGSPRQGEVGGNAVMSIGMVL